MRMASFVGLPESFKPLTSDWCLYLQCFEDFLLVNGVDGDSKQHHLLLEPISNSIFKLLANLVVSRKPREPLHKQICEQLQKHFSLKPVKIATSDKKQKR